ncbi:MAG: family 43 glycosylhydrolase [Clostridiales bacterium]|nr:family 43 glycosylhydrolase [Clostridiales bacterium]
MKRNLKTNKIILTSSLLILIVFVGLTIYWKLNKDATEQSNQEDLLVDTEDNYEPVIDESYQKSNTDEDDQSITKNDLVELFENITLKKPYKPINNGNPLITHSYGADPYAMVYGDRVYVYMTHDEYVYDADGNIGSNNYGRIRSLRCISSEDLVNWTDHGIIHIGGINGISSWAHNSWAPAATWKNIDGKDTFFLYFSNSASSIGVLTADSPTGPFTDPLGKPLITHDTPNCSGVVWLFDPDVLIDDDGKAYMYFGGGVPEDNPSMPLTGRVIELGSDMISTVGEAKVIEAPYHFEASGINKIGNTYYYTYCSNWNERTDEQWGHVPIAEIIYMTSDNPMGPWEYQGPILKNPGRFFGSYGNNHHSIVNFKDKYYIFYHTQLLQDLIGVTGGYRSTHVNELIIGDDGSILDVKADRFGVKQLKPFNPYRVVEATTMANSGGVSVIEKDKSAFKDPQVLLVSDIESGDWIQVSQVDFGNEGASSFTLSYSCDGEGGAVKVCIDALDGEAITYVEIEKQENIEDFAEVTVPIKDVTGVHDIYFIFAGSGYDIKSWSFSPVVSK